MKGIFLTLLVGASSLVNGFELNTDRTLLRHDFLNLDLLTRFKFGWGTFFENSDEGSIHNEIYGVRVSSNVWATLRVDLLNFY